jgi:glutaminyl-peptide cyclotransferase
VKTKPIGASIGTAVLLALVAVACGHGNATSAAASKANASASPAAFPEAASAPVIGPEDQAPPASQTGGFDGQKAYDFTAKLVSFGPRPPASEAIRRTQDYILGELKGFGCSVDSDDFHASTPIADLSMKNMIAKVPGTGQGVILLLTHYDTLRLDNFVGAEDGGSSTGLMMEMARQLCGSKSKQPNSVWIAFLDGEEAQVVVNGVAQWSDADSVYGSRELAARLAVSGDLKRVRAVILADMVGQKHLQIPREPSSDSTKWLTDLVWNTASRLGYGSVFVSREYDVNGDDHEPFLKRGVAAVDIIDLDGYQSPNPNYWHTTQDTMDKISPKSLAIVGHVILESVSELQQKFR